MANSSPTTSDGSRTTSARQPYDVCTASGHAKGPHPVRVRALRRKYVQLTFRR
ncbi:hypothetical protein [Streptomyces sp. YIM S03343]